MVNLTSSIQSKIPEAEWIVVTAILEGANNFIKVYFLPIGLLLNYLSNTLTICVLITGKSTKLRKTLRTNYLAIAILDQVVSIFSHLTYYMGMHIIGILTVMHLSMTSNYYFLRNSNQNLPNKFKRFR